MPEEENETEKKTNILLYTFPLKDENSENLSI